jgi:acyl-CoA thioester hydrolase
MPRIKINLPAKFPFNCVIPIRITDLNYGGHVGNDKVVSIIHEARAQFLGHFGFGEMNIGGAGLIMTDLSISFKNEIFYGDMIRVSVAPADFSAVAFDLYYKLEKDTDKGALLVAAAKTGMACYDYQNKKIAAFPEQVKKTLLSD